MTKPKLTPIFPHEVKPVRKGVYQTNRYSNPGYSYWNGVFWCNEAYTIDTAASPRWKNKGPGFQGKSWRGLAFKPRAKP